MSFARTAAFPPAMEISLLVLYRRQASSAAPCVGANLCTTIYNGKTETPRGVEAAKKLKMDQILLPCQEDFFKFMWSLCGAFLLAESQSIL